MSDVQRPDDTILHQSSVEAVIAERIDGVKAENVAIADLTAITGGESPTEAEYNTVVTKVNAILAALRNTGVIPTS